MRLLTEARSAGASVSCSLISAPLREPAATRRRGAGRAAPSAPARTGARSLAVLPHFRRHRLARGLSAPARPGSASTASASDLPRRSSAARGQRRQAAQLLASRGGVAADRLREHARLRQVLAQLRALR
jgi:hypothetical protein